MDPTRRKQIRRGTPGEDLLIPVLRGGLPVYDPPPVAVARARVQEQLASLHPGIKRFANPHQYPAGLSLELHDAKTRLILEARAGS